MSNNVPNKMKPFGTLRDFDATHSRHYGTFSWYITRLYVKFIFECFEPAPPPFLKENFSSVLHQLPIVQQAQLPQQGLCIPNHVVFGFDEVYHNFVPPKLF